MKGKAVRIINHPSHEGHHGIVVGLVPQNTVVVGILLRVKTKDGATIKCLRENLRDVPTIHQNSQAT